MTTHEPITVRPEHDDDHAPIERVVAAAFGQPAEARLVAELRRSDAFVPGWSLVGERAGTVVGHVMVTFAELVDDESDGRTRIPSLSPLAVHPDHQGRGVGSALVRAVTARVDAAGEPLVVVEGDPAYYGRFGFEHAVPLGIRIPLPDWAPAEAAQVLRLGAYDPRYRGTVVHPPAFDLVEEA